MIDNMMINTGDPMAEPWDVLGAALAKYYRSTARLEVLAFNVGVDLMDRDDGLTVRQVGGWLARTADRARLVAAVTRDYPLFPAKFEVPILSGVSGSLLNRLCCVSCDTSAMRAMTARIVSSARINWNGTPEDVWFSVVREAAAMGRLRDLEYLAVLPAPLETTKLTTRPR